MRIQINLISDMNSFVSVCSKEYAEDIYVKQDNQIINAKSLLGMYSLDWSRPVEVEIETDNQEIKEQFYKYIKAWEVR